MRVSATRNAFPIRVQRTAYISCAWWQMLASGKSSEKVYGKSSSTRVQSCRRNGMGPGDCIFREIESCDSTVT